MSEPITFTCSSCGKEHEQWPSLAFKTPDPYYWLSENEKTAIAEIDLNFCVIRYEDQTDRFIRCTLTQKVNDHCEDLEYGVWVTLSEDSFEDYKANFNKPDHETTYFGWLSSEIWGYTFKNSIPTNVVTRPGNLRPEVFPHKSCKDIFVKDYYKGISKEEAEKRIKFLIGEK